MTAIQLDGLAAAKDQTAKTRVAIAGATGYSGAELVRLLSRHAHAEIVGAYSSESFSIDALVETKPDVAFLATPNEVSADVAPQLLDLGVKVIDLSGAFRLGEPSHYPSWYGFEHPRPQLLAEAVYGLTELCNGELSKARLVANPGCYPTSVLLALRPLTYHIDRTQPVIIDAKSGVSGAGKKADVAYSFTELFGNFKAYGIGKHKHEPEIRQGLHLGERTALVFVPHLLPSEHHRSRRRASAGVERRPRGDLRRRIRKRAARTRAAGRTNAGAEERREHAVRGDRIPGPAGRQARGHRVGDR